jgi:hypothetical protein
MDNFYTVDMLNNEAERAINRHDSAVDLNNPARTGQNGRLFIPEGELGAPRYNLFQNQNQAHDLDAKIISQLILGKLILVLIILTMFKI